MGKQKKIILKDTNLTLLTQVYENLTTYNVHTNIKYTLHECLMRLDSVWRLSLFTQRTC